MQHSNKHTTEDRLKGIEELVLHNGSVRISDLSEHYKVSRETIRRDIIYLDSKGIVKKVHGGATAVLEFRNIPTEDRLNRAATIKERLCEEALRFIKKNDIIYLDAGSTVYYLAKLLSNHSGYTIVTSNIGVCTTLLNSNNTIIMCGGQVNAANQSVAGLQTINFLKELKVSVAFLGSNGFELHNGPAVTDFSDALVKMAILPNAKKKIVLSDSSKAFSSALIQFARWEDIDCLITDNQMPENLANKIKAMTNVIFVEV